MEIETLITNLNKLLKEKKEQKEILNYTYEKDYENDSIKLITEAYINKKIKFLLITIAEKIYLVKRIIEIETDKDFRENRKFKLKVKEYKTNIDLPSEVLKTKYKYYVKLSGGDNDVFSLFYDFLVFKIGIKNFRSKIRKLIVHNSH
ncbi:MAG: hypothetical protein N3A01_00085 [Bacteroidales bacterium]|nr:hypothetical protein [Bacteroidales bacterium]